MGVGYAFCHGFVPVLRLLETVRVVSVDNVWGDFIVWKVSFRIGDNFVPIMGLFFPFHWLSVFKNLGLYQEKVL